MKQVIETTYDPSTPRVEPVEHEPNFLKRISWGAIFAGVTAAVIVQMLLTLLGVGIGAATVNPMQEQAPGEGLGIGAMIWLFVSSIIAMYVGGRVAGRFSNGRDRQDRMQHGLLTWAATTILSAVFLASALTSLLGSAAGSAGGAAATQAAQKPGAVSSPNANPNDPAVAAANEQKARQAADVAAKRVSQSALATFFVLLLSALAAATGGRSSAPGSTQPSTRRESDLHAEPAFSKS